jgi:hypothetical protein
VSGRVVLLHLFVPLEQRIVLGGVLPHVLQPLVGIDSGALDRVTSVRALVLVDDGAFPDRAHDPVRVLPPSAHFSGPGGRAGE